jgi:prevent-host-death family protein
LRNRHVEISRDNTVLLATSRRYGYDSHIEDAVRSTNIADLRNRLTQYLREVRAGEEIVVRDRQRPIAKIVPLTLSDDSDDTVLVTSGLMRKGERALPTSFWRVRRAGVSPRIASAAVGADREGR